jgi:hypothetical protein
MELTIVRLTITICFIVFTSMAAVSFAGGWGYVLGGMMFGALTVFLWKERVIAETEGPVGPLPQDESPEHPRVPRPGENPDPATWR